MTPEERPDVKAVFEKLAHAYGYNLAMRDEEIMRLKFQVESQAAVIARLSAPCTQLVPVSLNLLFDRVIQERLNAGTTHER